MFRLGTVKANICQRVIWGVGTFRFAKLRDFRIFHCSDGPRLARTTRKEIVIATAEPEFSSEQVGVRFALGTILLVGAYAAWPMIPLVLAADLDPGVKAWLSGLLGATPFLSKFVAIMIMGRPAYYFLKRTVYDRIRRRLAGTRAE